MAVPSASAFESARARCLLQVRLTASAGQLLVSAFDDPADARSLGASILAPLFNGGRIQAQVDVAASRRDRAACVHRRTVFDAFRKLEDALAAADLLARRRERVEVQRAALASALGTARNRYQARYAGNLEQLDAQPALPDAELALQQFARTSRMGGSQSSWRWALDERALIGNDARRGGASVWRGPCARR